MPKVCANGSQAVMVWSHFDVVTLSLVPNLTVTRWNLHRTALSSFEFSGKLIFPGNKLFVRLIYGTYRNTYAKLFLGLAVCFGLVRIPSSLKCF